MKHQFLVWGLGLLVLGTGCQKESGSELGGGEIAVEVNFPERLARGSVRHRELLAHVSHLSLKVESKEGYRQELSISPQHWENIRLSGVDFPKSGSDELVIQAEIWEVGREAKRRTLPLLKGKQKIGAKQTRAVISLHYGVPFSEW